MTKLRLLKKFPEGLFFRFLPRLRMLFSIFFLLIVIRSFGQERVLTGTVTDEKGVPLQGATVQVKGGARSVTTNMTGGFSLSAPSGVLKLTVSYVGYEPVEVVIGTGTTFNVSMQPAKSSMNEVVVVGYGTQKRKDLTGSVSSVRGSAIKDLPVTGVTEALQGRAAGVEVIKSSGEPGASTGPTIIIRGVSSLHQPNPLYIVDGVRVPADNINVQDIASIDILKDASAAAIYGSAAAGGVILITTKKGSSSKPAINFNARYGVVKPKLITNLLNRDEYIRFQNIVNPQFFHGATQTDTLANTDWTKELFRNGIEQNYNLSVAGNTPSVNYLFSGFYNAQKGVYLNNYSNIGGVRINTDYKLGEYIKIGEQLSLSQRSTSPTVPNRGDLDVHNAPFRSLPVIPVFNKDGSWGTVPPGYNGLAFSGPNPVGAVENAQTSNHKNNLQGNVYAEVRLPFHLSFRTNLAYSYYLETQDYFQNSFNYGPGLSQSNNSLTKYFIESSQVLANYVLTYNQTVGKHSITALAGYEQIDTKFNTVLGYESSVGLNGYSFIQTSGSAVTVQGKNDPNGLIKSYFGRVNYNFDNKYYLSLSARQDGNFTVFGPNKQKANFGAASVGWNISDEEFFKSALPAINSLKLRGSYGTLGNSAINPYTYTATYSQFNTTGGISGGAQNFAPGAPLVIANTVNAIPNPNLHWETITETNIGLDGEAFKGKLYGSIEWYDKKTKDMLYALPLPLSSGFTQAYFTNIGNVSSKGVDILLGYRDKAGELGYDVSVTAGFNSNKVTNLDNITTDALYDGYNYYNAGDAAFNIMSNQTLTITKAGLPFGSFYGYKALGLFKTDAEAAAATAQPGAKAGDLHFSHDAKNGATLSPNDKQVIGNPNPKLVYGMNIRLNYRGFDASLLFNGVAGVQLFNGVKAYEMSPFQDGTTTTKVFGDSYFGNNGLTSQPRVGVVNTNGTFTIDPNGNYKTPSSYFVESGAYLKLKNVQLGYTFTGALLERAKIQHARLFVMANNLFTITKYSGLDPEVGSGFSQQAMNGYVSTNVGVTTRGLDAVPQYPQTRIYTVGLDVNF